MKILFKTLRIITVFTLLTASLLAVFYFGLKLFFSETRLKKIFANMARGGFNCELKTKSISFDIFKGFKLEGFEIYSYKDMATAKGAGRSLEPLLRGSRVLVKGGMFPFMRYRIKASEVIITEPVLNLNAFKRGRTNIFRSSNLKQGAGEKDTGGRGFRMGLYRMPVIPVLRIINGKVILEKATFTEIDLSARKAPVENIFNFECNFMINEAGVTCRVAGEADLKNNRIIIRNLTASKKGRELKALGELNNIFEKEAFNYSLEVAGKTYVFNEIAALFADNAEFYLGKDSENMSINIAGSMDGFEVNAN